MRICCYTLPLKEAKHRHDTCMLCSKTPMYEILWAEGRAHAWFCEGCLKKWATTGDGWHDIDSAKEIKDGEAAKKFGDNSNPNISPELKRKFGLKEAVLPYKPEEMRNDQLADDWRIFGSWISTLKDTGKFKYSESEILNKFTIPALKEILKRGKQEFHPENWKDNPKELYLKAFDKIVKKYIKLTGVSESLERIAKGKEILLEKKFIVGNFYSVLDDKKEIGYIRLDSPEKKDNQYQYKVRDFIPRVKSHFVESMNDGVFGNREDLKESDFKPERFDAKVLSELSDMELIQRHAEIHEIFEQRGKRKDDELVINAHLLILDLMKERGLEHRPKEELDMLKLKEDVKGKSFLKDAIKYWDKDFYLKDPFLALTGGTAVSGYGTDNDIWVNLEPNEKCPQCSRLLNVLDFRLRSMLPKDKESLPHLVPEPEGKFTNYVPLARLKVEMIPPSERELLKMALQEQEPRATEKDVLKMMKDSRVEDKIRMFRFYQGMKPTRAAKPNERMTVDFFVSLFMPEDYKNGIFSSKKYDGMRILVFADKPKKKIEIWSEDGELITDRLPQHQEQIWNLNFKQILIEAELEAWDNKSHRPREATAGYIHAKTPADDSNLVSNVYTILYLDGKDLHKETESARQEALKKIGIPQSTWDVPDLKKKYNLVPNLLSHSEKELRKHTEEVRWKIASEGNVGKKSDSKYYLDGRSRDGWIKFHNNAMIFGKVIERITTKVPTIFNYRYGIDPEDYNVEEKNLAEVKGEELIEVGKSFNTDTKLDVGETIAIEFETFNFIKDEKTGTVSVSAWAPRFIVLENVEMAVPKETDTITDVLNRARKNKVLQVKRITKEGETLYESLTPEYSEIDSIESIEKYIEFMQEHHNADEAEIRRAIK